MKQLEKSFSRKKFQYDQVIRKGNLAIYTQTHIESKSQTFEVIVIKSHNGYEIAGTRIEPAEVYPGDNQWGILGWTCQTLDAAKNKLKTLEESK